MRDLVISTKFQWIPSQIQIAHFQNFRYNSGAINNEEKSYNKRYLPPSFSKYNKTSPKLVYPEEISATVVHAKFQLILMQNPKVWMKTRSTHKASG